MPTDLDFANDLNLDSTDTQQIVNRLRACVHFLTKIDARTKRIEEVLGPSPPPIHPDIKAQVASIVALADSVLSTSRRLNLLPVQDGGIGGDGGE